MSSKVCIFPAISLVLGSAVALSVTACGSSDSSAASSMVATSTSGELRATIRPKSDPPPLGNQTMALDLVYVDGGAPASGMALTIVPWMPAMDHGTSIVPSAAETSPGTYTLSNVDLFMPGVWELRTAVKPAGADGGSADQVAPSLDVP